MEAFSADIERKIKALVKVGIYSSEMEVIKDAIKNLFRDKSDLNVSAAVELYSPSFPLKNQNHWQATQCLPEFS